MTRDNEISSDLDSTTKQEIQSCSADKPVTKTTSSTDDSTTKSNGEFITPKQILEDGKHDDCNGVDSSVDKTLTVQISERLRRLQNGNDKLQEMVLGLSNKCESLQMQNSRLEKSVSELISLLKDDDRLSSTATEPTQNSDHTTTPSPSTIKIRKPPPNFSSDSVDFATFSSLCEEEKKLRRNLMSRQRESKLRERFVLFKEQKQDPSPAEAKALESYEMRRQRKNARSRERNGEKQHSLQRILQVPEAERCQEDTDTLERLLDARKRKNECDRIRRQNKKTFHKKIDGAHV